MTRSLEVSGGDFGGARFSRQILSNEKRGNKDSQSQNTCPVTGKEREGCVGRVATENPWNPAGGGDKVSVSWLAREERGGGGGGGRSVAWGKQVARWVCENTL